MGAMPVKLALSTLCENPGRRTGLSTLFTEFVRSARRVFPGVSWIVFVGANAPWEIEDPQVEVCRKFPSNEYPARRLAADHFRVAPEARRRGAAALLTVGFHPLDDAGLPVAMHVVALVEPGDRRGLRSTYRSWAVSRGLERARLIIANSEWTKAQLGTAAGTVIVSPEGLRHDLFHADGARGAPGVAGRYVLWASNLYPYKRIELALAAYAGLPKETRARIPFVVAGGDWAGGRALAQAAAVRLGIIEDVRFLGWVSDELLPVLYRGAQVHVLSTARETFGRSVLESMACGCPNVLQDLPVLREVAGACATYVDFGAVPAATAALTHLCSDEARRAQMIAAGIERSRSFSFERLARERVGAVLAAIGKGTS
jgi:glycosyltransferase involved in cell wall biosynthesis